MALAGHLSHYYQGTHHPSPPVLLYSSGFHVDAACLASRQSLQCLALAGRSL